MRLVAFGAALVLAAGLVTAPWAGHVDDTDAQLYQVVARHMVEDATWLELRYLPAVHARFREHLPFGLWPQAAAIRALGEGALAPLTALWTLATVALVGWLGTRLFGARAGLVAMLVLATTETFFIYGGRPRLDPLLVLLTTLSAAPLLLGRRSLGAFLVVAGAGAAAALVKGPFGLLPMVAAGAARALVTRELRPVAQAAVATLLAALPVTGFLLWDHLSGTGTWWDGYVREQLLASATGARVDGKLAFWYPFRTVGGRFWPGLPLVLLGAWLALRSIRPGRRDTPVTLPDETAVRTVALFSLLVLLGLCVPARKVWNHALVAYPGLALLAGAGAMLLIERFLPGARRQRTAVVTLVALAVATSVASAMGVGRLLLPKPCVASSDFASELDKLPPGSPIAVVAANPSWRLIASLAAERRLAAAPATHLEEASSLGARMALAEEALLTMEPAPDGWRKLQQARGWILLERGTDPIR
jgi:4-amino-4-deoxy-L-arabinose transferase-like glycosyltransferase